MFSKFLDTWIGMTVLVFVVIFVMFSLLFFLSWDEDDRKEGFQVAFFIALFFSSLIFLSGMLRRLLATWVGSILVRLYFVLCFVLPISGFVIGCENALYDHRGFSTWDWEVFWHGTPEEKEAIQRRREARYMHMTNAERWEEVVIGIKGGALLAFVSLWPLFIIAGLAGKLDKKETDE